MGFTDAVRTCLSKYADFNGRASRSEYWYFTLFTGLLLLGGFVAMGIGDVVIGENAAGIVFGILAVVVFLGMFLPALAVGIRRLHDTNSSGWWYLVFLLPYVGGLIMVIWCCIKGTEGDNRFGPDPLQENQAGVAEAFS